MKIVLLGSIPKGDAARKGWTDWKVSYMEAIKKVVADVIFIHGDTINMSRVLQSDQLSIRSKLPN